MSMTAKIDNYIPGFRKTAGLVKREVLDQKTGFITVPLVVAGLLILATVGNALYNITDIYAAISAGKISFGGFADAESNEIVLHEVLDEVGSEKIKSILSAAAFAISTPMLMILPFVMINALLSTLFDDRKDRSYLFFKSMPVSDRHEVIVKVVVITLGAPLITLFVAFITQLIMAASFTLMFMPAGFPVGAVWMNMPTLSVWAPVFITMIAYMLWAFPFIGWGIAVSAYAPKAPLMVAVVPLVAVSIVEQVVMHSDYFAKWLLGYAGTHFGMTALGVKEGSIGMVINELDDAKINMLSASDAFAILGKTLTQADFWIGLAIGVALIAAAIRGRKYNV